MSSIGSQQKAADSHRWGESLMDLVRADIDNLVLIWIRSARQKLLELLWLSSQQFFSRQARNVSICDTPKAVLPDPGCHEEMFWMDYEVGVFPTKFAEVIVRLCQQDQ
jgi:hypothetical protein